MEPDVVPNAWTSIRAVTAPEGTGPGWRAGGRACVALRMDHVRRLVAPHARGISATVSSVACVSVFAGQLYRLLCSPDEPRNDSCLCQPRHLSRRRRNAARLHAEAEIRAPVGGDVGIATARARRDLPVRLGVRTIDEGRRRRSSRRDAAVGCLLLPRRGRPMPRHWGVQVEQNRTSHHPSERVRNDRILSLPVEARRERGITSLAALSARVREELEQFAIAATVLERQGRANRRVG